MNQTRLESFIEAAVNTFVGFFVTLIMLPIVNHLCDIEMSKQQMGLSTALFTAISVLRGYVVRRFFNNFKRLKLFIKRLIIKDNG